MDGSAYEGITKIESLLGTNFWKEIENKVVVDFGCGSGSEAIEMAKHGARKVIGIDIQEKLLSEGRKRALDHGLNDSCVIFTSQTAERADVIISIDSFEHFYDPSEVLKCMSELLRPGGCVFAASAPHGITRWVATCFRCFLGHT
jgi:2-polyprenyl-3-methyl-5-hydroxy-6-metoxy-1,4-benzoquinol methylase